MLIQALDNPQVVGVGAYSTVGPYKLFGLSGWRLIQRWAVNQITQYAVNKYYSTDLEIPNVDYKSIYNKVYEHCSSIRMSFICFVI